MSEFKDDLSSTVSGFSTVSIDGEAVSCEKAVDESILDMQGGLNNIHVGVRNMLMADERGDDYNDTLEEYTKLYSLLDELIVLTKDLKKIVKQVQPKKPRKTN